jgi:hypothetical protein
MVVKRQQETFAPVTMGHIRSLGWAICSSICTSGRCHHRATLRGTGSQTRRPCALFARGWCANAAR